MSFRAYHCLMVVLLLFSLMAPAMAQNQDQAKSPPGKLGQPVAYLPIRWPHGRLPQGRLSLTVHKGTSRNQTREYVLKKGRQTIAPFSFAPLFTDQSLWSAADNNNHEYQLNRGFFDASAYDVHGMVLIGGTLYLCVAWYSPAASDIEQFDNLVLKVEFVPQGARVTVLRKDQVPESEYLRRGNYLPQVENIGGNLVFDNADYRYEYMPKNGHWKRIGKTPSRLKADDANRFWIGWEEHHSL